MNTDEIDSSQYEEALDQGDEQQELLEAQSQQLEASYPTVKEESNLYNLFWKVLQRRDSTKVANLKKDEIGNLNITVRDAQKLGMLGHLFGHETFGDFFFAVAEITNSTSMAKDGWFTELFVSQKKFATRARRSSTLTRNKWKLFGQKNQNTQEQQ